ncbi:MAG: polyamine aminopropyltransferase [Candidatus Caenarcaniphilales bacterium]|nr:polyamine aminopropyltransferase [Candidatus Caenarcaniphilales bacterium]
MFSSLSISEIYKNTALTFRVKEVLYRERSPYQMIEIVDTYDWGKVLQLDGLMMTSAKDEIFYHETIAHLPVTLKPTIEKALVIGGGDGGTVRELLKYPQIKEIHLAEIDEEVVRACQAHLPELAGGLSDPRVKCFFQDAALFVQDSPAKTYDLIISDSSDPVDFAAVLIEGSFFESVKRILKPDGIFIAQTNSPLAQPEEVKAAWDNLKRVFAYQQIAWSLIPIYPGAFWTFTLASQSEIPLKIHPEYHKPETLFWQAEFSTGLMTVPPFVRQILDS